MSEREALAKQIRRLKAAGSSGEWNTGPETSAGHVWLKKGGWFVLEPTHSWWGRVFRIRRDEEPQWIPGDDMQREAAKQEFWRRRQADVELMALLLNNADLIAASLDWPSEGHPERTD